MKIDYKEFDNIKRVSERDRIINLLLDRPMELNTLRAYLRIGNNEFAVMINELQRDGTIKCGGEKLNYIGLTK